VAQLQFGTVEVSCAEPAVVLSPSPPALQRQRMRAIFEHGCKLEYMFFDACHTQQQWPL